MRCQWPQRRCVAEYLWSRSGRNSGQLGHAVQHSAEAGTRSVETVTIKPQCTYTHIRRRSMLAVVIMHVNQIAEQDSKNKLHWKASQYYSVHLCQKRGISRQQQCFVKTVRTVLCSVSEYKSRCTVEPRSIVPVSIVFPHLPFTIFGPE